MVRFGPACNGSEHRFPAGGLRETLIEENFEATVVLKGGFGIDFYATRQLAVSVEGRFDWIEGFGSVPLDLSVSLLYRF